MTSRIVVKKNRGNIIHLQNTVNMVNIGRVDMHPPLIHIINMKVNHLVAMVTILVIYRQVLQIMFQNLQKHPAQEHHLQNIPMFLVFWFQIK